MSQIDELLTLATDFEKEVEELIKSAKKKGKFPFWLKKKEKDTNSAKDSKLDPKAKVRNRGKVALPAEHPKVKDKQDHYPCNDAGQARSALSRVSQHPSAPPWFKGSLSELQNIVRRFVKKHYPSIEVSSPKKKAFEISEQIIAKYC